MARTISQHEMDRRKAMAQAACILAKVMDDVECPSLTAM